MPHFEFVPQIAVREERRQANEALGRSFAKAIAELVTNSDASVKRKLGLPQSTGLVDLMLRVPKGQQLDTSALRSQLQNKSPRRTIVVEVVTAKSSGRPVGEVVVIDQAQGMSAEALKTALSDIGGDRQDLHGGAAGRNLFGRGLSDVMRAYAPAPPKPPAHADRNAEPIVQTYDGRQLTTLRGFWPKNDRWKIDGDSEDSPSKKRLAETFLNSGETGTAVRFVITDRKRCHIPDPADIEYRLANFYMLRLIAADPNLELVLKQSRAAGGFSASVAYDFPVGQVIESFTKSFSAGKALLPGGALSVDFLLVRSESDRRGLGVDRDARENGLLIVDDLDAVYDLTFADPDYERADFLKRLFGVVRVNGLRNVLESYLNSPDFPTSPLRVDRDGFNRDHEFGKALLEFIAETLRPYYEKERLLAEQKDQGELSAETRKRIADALRHLNKYFNRITELTGLGTGADDQLPAPEKAVLFWPGKTRLIAGRPRDVLLLVRDDIVKDGCELIATAGEGLSVEPPDVIIYKKKSPRWPPHPNFLAFRFTVACPIIGHHGEVKALIECADGKCVDALLEVEDVLAEPEIIPPENMEFRPTLSLGRPLRRNNLVLFVNPKAIPAGHHVRFTIERQAGHISLVDPSGQKSDQLDIKLDASIHQVKGQNVFRILVPWVGTAWSQRALVEARVKVGGPTPLTARAHVRLDEPEPNEGGFFKEVKYGPIDQKAPSQFAAGVITVNSLDPLNQRVFGKSKEEYDRRVSQNPAAQQRLASILLEEASFRALQQLYDDNKVQFPARREIGEVHRHIDEYKFSSASDVHAALVK